MDSNKDEDAVAAFISDPTEEEDNSSGLSLHLPLPSAFLDFLKENGLDPSIYHAAATGDIKIPRYIRLKPGCESQLAEIEAELKFRLNKVDWLPGFFAIQSQIQIASTNAYRSGKIYGMDAASGAAVMALNISPGDHILDLCTAPGAKLCMISDILGNSGSLTGVDIAKHRLAACRTMLQKYALGDRCRLFVADGTTFSLLPLRSHTTATCSEDIKNIFIEWNSKRLWRDRKYARKAKHSTELQADPETTEPELIFYGKDSGVVGLHRSELYCAVNEVKYLISGYDKLKLLSNGFRLLKVGGSLVYSTCSLTISQNEDVVEQFLSKNSSAVLQEIDAADNWHCKSGRIPKTLRFDPKASQTSGLFIAKLKKVAL